MLNQNLEDRTKYVKLPFNSEIGNPIYVPKGSAIFELITNINVVDAITTENDTRAGLFTNHGFNTFYKPYFNKKYSAKDITELTRVISKEMLMCEESNIVVSQALTHLINSSKDKEHIVTTKSMGFDLVNFGFRNKKNIIVEGDLGDVSPYFQKGGKITVEGNVGEGAGTNMKNGTLHIKGSTGEHLGEFMENGTIMVDGDIGGIGITRYKGNIIHKGKLIVKNGKLLDYAYF